jgi:imidazolonepropionase-like amidohydrolase
VLAETNIKVDDVSEQPGFVVFTGAHVVVGDGSTTIEDGSIVVRDGVIEEVARSPLPELPVGALHIDLAGKTVMPTIVNPHGHIGYLRGAVASKDNYSRDNVLDHLRRLAYYGVSAFQSLGTDRDDIEINLRDEQRAGTLSEPGLPLLFSASNGLAAPTPGTTNGGAFFAPDAIQEVSTPREARAAVRALSAKNPDAIKFWVDDRGGTKQKLDPEIYAAIVSEAHEQGHIAIAHIFELDDAKGVVRAGVDGIAHMVRAPGPDDELIELLLANDVFVFTSMSIQNGMLDDSWLDSPAVAETVAEPARLALREQLGSISPAMRASLSSSYAILEEGLRRCLAGGVRLILSGDTGVLTQFFGITEHRELAAMVHAGMPAHRAIAAGTQDAAALLGMMDRGTIRPGKRADLLVLNDDPLKDIENTSKISAVYLGGRAVDRIGIRSGLLT